MNREQILAKAETLHYYRNADPTSRVANTLAGRQLVEIEANLLELWNQAIELAAQTCPGSGAEAIRNLRIDEEF